MKKVFCGPDGTNPISPTDEKFVLYNRSNLPDVGYIGADIAKKAKNLNLLPDSKSWDFLSLALSVIAADKCYPRNTSADGWTRIIDLTVSVSNPALGLPQ